MSSVLLEFWASADKQLAEITPNKPDWNHTLHEKTELLIFHCAPPCFSSGNLPVKPELGLWILGFCEAAFLRLGRAPGKQSNVRLMQVNRRNDSPDAQVDE